MRWKIIFSLAILISLSPLVLRAANQSDLEQEINRVRKERETLLEEQQRLQNELETVNKEAQSLGSAVKSLDTTQKKLAKDISITQSKVTSTNLTIKSLENTMSEKEKQIIIHRGAIKDTLISLSEYDSRSLLFNLLASVKLSNIWNDKNQLEGLSSRLEEEINNLRQTRQALSQEKKQKERVREEQVNLQSQLTGQKSVVVENQKAKERLLTETKNKEAEYQKMLADNIANQKQFEEDLFRLESELRISIDPSLIPTPRNGLLFWPLDKVYVTRLYGDTTFDGKPHNGTDFRAAQGTPVKAMLDGTIEGIGNTDEMNVQLRREGKSICVSYGRWVLIKYNNGLSSVYAHLSASIVKTGQNIRVGDIIGYSGGTPGVQGSGYSNGPHLHVGLFASQGVEVRQFTTSINCKHVFVPIADPKAYLNPLSYLPTI